MRPWAGNSPAAAQRRPHTWRRNQGIQASLAIEDALQRAGVKPGDLCAVQAHATGTSLGDLAEARALRRSLGPPPITSPSSPPRASWAIFWEPQEPEAILGLQALRRGRCPASNSRSPRSRGGAGGHQPEPRRAVASGSERLMLKTPLASAVTTSASCCLPR